MKDNEFDCEVLDSDACDGTDKDTVCALDFSFMRVDPTDRPKTIFCGQGTDASSGVTRLGLIAETEKLNRASSSTKNHASNMFSTWSQHFNKVTK